MKNKNETLPTLTQCHQNATQFKIDSKNNN